MSVGLVLEGGAMRGLYTAGVLDVFLDNDIKVDGIIGVSAGALFGVNLPSKQKGRAIRYNKKYANDKRYMGINSFIKTGNIVNKDFAYYEVPFKLDAFDEETYEKSNIDFYATLTNVDTGKAEYIKIVRPIDQMETMRASAAMPLVSKMVEVDGKKYLDGGVADSIPIDKCISMGYDKIIVVLTRPAEYRKKKSNNTLAKMMYSKYPNLINSIQNRYLNYNNSVEKVNELYNKKEILLIRPSRFVDIKRIEHDANKLQEIYNLGVEDCNNKLQELREYIGV